MIIDIEQQKDRLRISYFGVDGQVKLKDIAIPKSERFRWELCGSDRRDPFYSTWDDKPVKKAYSNWLSKFRIEEFLSTLPKDIQDEIYDFNQPDVWFCDIEVEVGEEFPDPSIAATPVLAVALVNKGNIWVLGIKELSSQEKISIESKLRNYFKSFETNISFEYIFFKSESEMLYTLFNKWIKNIPLLTGWNFTGFDWKYLVNRYKRLGLDPADCSINNYVKDDECFPQHKVIVDYMDLYKRWDRVIKIKENNKLETVAQAALGVSKIKYSGTFMDLYNTDFETYIYYNAVDTYLVYLLDKKIKTLQIFLMLGSVTRVESMKAISPIWMTEAIVTREFYKRKKVVAEVKKSVKKNSFEGAYVKQPEPGMHEWIANFDFASLYPSTMRQWNISPETFKGLNVELQDGWVKTASGAVFDNTTDSILRTVLTDFFNMRKVAKKKAFQIDMEVDYLEKILATK